ncbi:MAG: hypothetical protein GYB21_18650 [Oceanospirillales bacterium]|nr:hypothetical protein [Oceanospirillales bacterium]
MDDKSWQRHANPWSVYSRFSALPLISLAFWSREWLGAYALVPILLSLLWVWINPRVFGVPERTDNWASRGTFGERIYLNRHTESIPAHHLRACRVLQALSLAGVPVFIYGLYTLDLATLLLGNLWVMAFKAWFVDRMVWLYMDMKEARPEPEAQ